MLRRTSVRMRRSSLVTRRAAGAALEALEGRRLLAADALDDSFGTDGIVLDPLGGPQIGAVAVNQTNGKITAVGDSGTLTLAQYNSSGVQQWWTNLPSNFQTAVDVAIDSVGRIVVVGTSVGQNFVVARYNDDGTIDAPFGNGSLDTAGTYEHARPGTEEASGVAIQSGDGILVVGTEVGVDDFAVLQLNSGGVPTEFGDANPAPDGGFLLLDLGTAGDAAFGVAYQGTTAVIVGEATPSTTLDFALVRMAADGTFTQTITPGPGDEGLRRVAVGNGGAIYATGIADQQPVLVTYSSAGAFGASAPISGASLALGIAVDGAGNVAVATTNTNFDALGLTRYLPDGTPDANFGTAGSVSAPTGGTPGTVATYDVAFQAADGKPVVFGSSDNNFALARWGDAGGGEVVTAQPVGNNLVITGTDAADVVSVVSVGTSLEVRVNGEPLEPVSQFAVPASGKIIFNAGAGNDSFDIAANVANHSEVYGGDGDDTLSGGGGDDWLNGGAGHDILVGNGGGDVLAGGDGLDIMIGGTGADRIAGNAESDVLVSGSTDFDANLPALEAIQQKWLAPGTFLARVNSLQSGGYALIAGDTVNDDGVRDTLTGGAGSDWFLIQLNGPSTDLITDINAIEFLGVLDFILTP